MNLPASKLLASSTALDYVFRGLPVFPCLPCGKTPAVARGCHAATTNPETIPRYWCVPDRNIRITTGALSGVWVLDIDGEIGGASLSDLEERHGTFPATFEVTTGPGRHLWFAYSAPIQSTAKIAMATSQQCEAPDCTTGAHRGEARPDHQHHQHEAHNE